MRIIWYYLWARIKILRPLFNTNTPLKPPFGHFGNHFGPRKSDFWPFFYFGHFPIEISIEAEKIYQHGKELSYRENKMCSETSEAVGTIWEHAQKEFQKFLKIRITLVRQ